MIEKEELLLEGKSSYTAEIIGCLFFIFCGICGVYNYLTLESEILAVRYIFVALCALLALIFIFVPFSFKCISVSKEHLIVKYLITNKIKNLPLAEILYWTEKTRKNKKGETSSKLGIYTQDQHVFIKSEFFENYPEIKAMLTKERPRNIVLEKKQEDWRIRKNAFLFLIFFVFLLKQAYFLQFVKPRGFNDRDLYVIRDVVREIKHTPHRHKQSPKLVLLLENNQAFEFHLTYNAYYATYVNWFLQTVQRGDSINLFVSKKEYNTQVEKLKRHLSKPHSLTFWSNTVHIYGLNAHDNEYFIRKDFNRDQKIEVFISAWICTVVSILGFLISIAFLINPDQEPTNLSPDHQKFSHSDNE